MLKENHEWKEIHDDQTICDKVQNIFLYHKLPFCYRYVYDYYSAQYKPTVGVDFHLKPLKIDGTDFNVSFWDIVGADKAGSVAKVQYITRMN